MAVKRTLGTGPKFGNIPAPKWRLERDLRHVSVSERPTTDITWDLYLKYLSDPFKSLRMMMNKVTDDIPGAIFH